MSYKLFLFSYGFLDLFSEPSRANFTRIYQPVRYMLICKSGYSFSDVFRVSVDIFAFKACQSVRTRSFENAWYVNEMKMKTLRLYKGAKVFIKLKRRRQGSGILCFAQEMVRQHRLII